MMRDAQRIEHMLNFVRRSLEILDGVDQAEFIAAIGLQEQVEVNMIHLGEAAARMSDELKEKRVFFRMRKRHLLPALHDG
ncbi:MAG: hypothetical protein ACI4TC_10355, partial [Kiritimatiellia bacterium]